MCEELYSMRKVCGQTGTAYDDLYSFFFVGVIIHLDLPLA